MKYIHQTRFTQFRRQLQELALVYRRNPQLKTSTATQNQTNLCHPDQDKEPWAPARAQLR